MATKKEEVYTGKVTEDAFLEFVKEKKLIKNWPNFSGSGTSTEALLCASFLINTLTSLNEFLLEKQNANRPRK